MRDKNEIKPHEKDWKNRIGKTYFVFCFAYLLVFGTASLGGILSYPLGIIDSESMFGGYLVLGSFLSLFIFLPITLLWQRTAKTKCDLCGKAFSLKYAGSTEQGREEKWVKLYVGNGSWQYVPGVEITYEDRFVCKHCGGEYRETRFKGEANTARGACCTHASKEPNPPKENITTG